jgi:hypothetical protein
VATERKVFGVERGGTYSHHYVLKAELQSGVRGSEVTRQFLVVRPAAISLNGTRGIRIAQQIKRLAIPRVTFRRAAREPAHCNYCGPLLKKVGHPCFKEPVELNCTHSVIWKYYNLV